MIAAALEAEVEEYVALFTEERGEDGKRLVVRNGRAKERRLTVGSGTVGIRAPRVDDRRVDEEGERQKFSSRILPAYARRSPKVTDVLPVLYLHGLSTGDFGPALRDLPGEHASGLSPGAISRLTKQWESDHEAFKARSLRFPPLRLPVPRQRPRLGPPRRGRPPLPAGGDRRARGRQQGAAGGRGRQPGVDRLPVAVLRDLRDRGMSGPKLVSADGALGAWTALRDVFPQAREQRCWVHKTANVLDALPKRLQPRAKSQLHEMA